MNFWDKVGKNYGHKKRIGIYDKHQRHNEKLFDSVLEIKGKNILDAGCGEGRWSFWLAQKAKEVQGIDNSKLAIKLANKDKSLYKIKNVHFRQGSITKLPYKDDEFETTFLCIVLQHVLGSDFKKAVKELIRVTKPGGKIVFFEIVKKYEKKKKGYIECRSPKEYVRAFKPCKLEKHIGVRFPYFTFGLLFALKKMMLSSSKQDVRDTYALWDKIRESKAFWLYDLMFELTYYAAYPLSLLSRKIPSLSAENIFVFKV